MLHLPILIQDLALILSSAAVVSVIFKKLKQPVVLGYLLAGFLVGPNFGLFPTVKDSANISVWAEIGVVFMLFGLGLEFSFKKLSKVGKSASITASIEILMMLGLGYFVGQALSWSFMDSLFLGGILSISSTTIIVRAFEELSVKGKAYVDLVLGVLVVEDLLAILLLVLLSSVALGQSFSGAELLLSSSRLVFFIVLCFLLGIYLLPALISKMKELLSDETLLIVSLGLCLMMVLLATRVGFSPALGAFVMGSILAETPKGPKIEHLIVPLKNLFSAIFFVSVGMLFDWKILVDHFWIILAICTVTIIGKVMSSSLGAILSGRSFKTSIKAGMSLAQIGEFSFIIATLGKSLKVTSDFLYPIAVVVSAITTFSTPYLIRVSDPLSEWLFQKIPSGMKVRLSRYESAMSISSEENVLGLLWREYGLKIFLNAIVVLAIPMAIESFVLPLFSNDLRTSYMNLGLCILTLILVSPFLWAITIGGKKTLTSLSEETLTQLKRLQLGVLLVRILIACVLIMTIIARFTSLLASGGIFAMGLAMLGFFFFSKKSHSVYSKIENNFVSNLSGAALDAITTKEALPELAPWDVNLTEFVLSGDSSLVGKSLQQSQLKEKFDLTVAMILRGSRRILAPKAEELLLPGDRLFLIGAEESLSHAKNRIEVPVLENGTPAQANLGLISLVIRAEDEFVNKSIRDCGLREKFDALIVGIERNGVRVLNPSATYVLAAHDLLWFVGNKKLVKAYYKQNSL